MHILEISTVLLVIASAFSLVNLRILKLPLTIGLMVQGLIMSFVILGIGTVYPPFLDKATALTQTFDFSELLVNVMLPFLLFAGAIGVNVHELLKDKTTILFLASFGVPLFNFCRWKRIVLAHSTALSWNERFWTNLC